MRALSLAVLAGLVIASPAQLPLSVESNARPRPLVIWHGLGDTAHSEGMESFADYIKQVHPGIYVHSVISPDNGNDNDQRNAGWWGVAEDFAHDGCDQIAEVPELADGFDAIGFSQGGLFLRWYAQYCKGPKLHNLITFGSPHYGIAALIPCPDPPTLSCRLAARAAKAGIYTQWAQKHLIQAQYYRDPARLDEFLFTNTFIRDLNSEQMPEDPDQPGDGSGPGQGGRGLKCLDNLVALAFKQDKTLFPGLSAHWATIHPSNISEIIPMEKQQLYQEDWIGIKALDKKKKLHLEFCEGEHMDLGGENGCGARVVKKWIGWKL